VEPVDSNGLALPKLVVPVATFREFFRVVTDAEEVADKGIVRFEGQARDTQEYKQAVSRAAFFYALETAKGLQLPKAARVPFKLETKPEKKAPWLLLDID
jgi:hypothetical protein